MQYWNLSICTKSQMSPYFLLAFRNCCSKVSVFPHRVLWVEDFAIHKLPTEFTRQQFDLEALRRNQFYEFLYVILYCWNNKNLCLSYWKCVCTHAMVFFNFLMENRKFWKCDEIHENWVRCNCVYESKSITASEMKFQRTHVKNKTLISVKMHLCFHNWAVVCNSLAKEGKGKATEKKKAAKHR